MKTNILTNPKDYSDRIVNTVPEMDLEGLEEEREEARLPRLNRVMREESI